MTGLDNTENIATSPDHLLTTTLIGDLRAYCQQDEATMLPGFADSIGLDDQTDLSKAKERLLSGDPLTVTPQDGLVEYTKPDLSYLDADLQNDDSQYKNVWRGMRTGEAGSETLNEATKALKETAPAYAARLIEIYKKARQTGGLIAQLAQGGYTKERIENALSKIAQLKPADLTQAADIMKSDSGQATPLTSVAQMNAALSRYLHGEQLPEIINPEFEEGDESIFLHAQVTSDNSVELRTTLVRGESMEPAQEIHEKAHALLACDLAQSGYIISAIAPYGIQETFARLLGGYDKNEALLFATFVEESYRNAEFIDSLCNELTEEGLNSPELAATIANHIMRDLSQEQWTTGIHPIPGSGAFPLGSFMPAYILDAIESLELRAQIERDGIDDPIKIMQIVKERYGYIDQTLPPSKN